MRKVYNTVHNECVITKEKVPEALRVLRDRVERDVGDWLFPCETVVELLHELGFIAKTDESGHVFIRRFDREYVDEDVLRALNGLVKDESYLTFLDDDHTVISWVWAKGVFGQESRGQWVPSTLSFTPKCGGMLWIQMNV